MLDPVDKAYRKLSSDLRINVWHISLFMALLYLWKQYNFQNPFPVIRKTVMALAHVHSIATYHKFMKELQQFGYIHYLPSFHPGIGSSITVLIE